MALKSQGVAYDAKLNPAAAAQPLYDATTASTRFVELATHSARGSSNFIPPRTQRYQYTVIHFPKYPSPSLDSIDKYQTCPVGKVGFSFFSHPIAALQKANHAGVGAAVGDRWKSKAVEGTKEGEEGRRRGG